MSTLIVLEDGRILGVSNGQFDGILSVIAEEISGAESEMASWLLEQRCIVLGPGVGSVDLRELSPKAQRLFRSGCERVYDRVLNENYLHDRGRLPDLVRQLVDMWASIDRGEPPEALTCPWWLLHPASGERHGPGW